MYCATVLYDVPITTRFTAFFFELLSILFRASSSTFSRASEIFGGGSSGSSSAFLVSKLRDDMSNVC